MALDIYELIPKIETLHGLCHEQNIVLDPEPGSQILYSGQLYYVVSSKGDSLALINDMPSIPLDPERVVYIHDWEQESNCLLIPTINNLLSIIHHVTSLYPSMIPGVKKTREVWQVRHAEGSTVVTGSLLEGLLDIALELMQKD